MTIKYADRVRETSVTTGAGNLTLAGAASSYKDINGVFNNDTDATGLDFDYVINHATNSSWEVGTGHLTVSNIMSRDTVDDNSNGNTSKINFAVGGLIITITPSRKTLAQLEVETLTATGTGHFGSGSGATAGSSQDNVVAENGGSAGFTALSTDATNATYGLGSTSSNLGAFFDWSYDGDKARIGSLKVGATFVLGADAFVTNITLSGAAGSELCAVTKDMTVGGDVTLSGTSIIDSSVSNSSLLITGDTVSNTGANFTLYGGSHATLANDFRFRSGSTTELYYDDSASTWDFQSNDVAVGGDVTLTTGLLSRSSTDSITAGSTQTQAGATALTTDLNRVTISATNGDGVKLPSARAGLEILIINDDSTETIQVWPDTDDAIDAESVDAVDPNALAAGAKRRYVAFDAVTWITAS